MDKIKIGNNTFDTLLAITTEEQEKGLMHRDPPLPVMAFVYSFPLPHQMWMKNTRAPLDIVFCLRGKVSSIWHGEPFSTRVLGGDQPSDLVVELPAGTCKDAGIKPGDRIELALTEQAQFKLLMQKTGIIF